MKRIGKKTKVRRMNFENSNKEPFSPIVSPADQEAINNFVKNDPTKKFADLQSYDLNRPLVTPEEQQVIDQYFKTSASAWIQTYTGKKFFPLSPNIEDIDILDIAHALSMQCRYTGHCREFYSTAQHSVLVSYLCDAVDAPHGLLHDGSETYLIDVPSPLKRTPEFGFYRKSEHKLQSMIYKKFGLAEQEPASVKRADILMLATEAADLLSPIHPEWKMPANPLPMKIKPLSPIEAEALFLARFNELVIQGSLKSKL